MKKTLKMIAAIAFVAIVAFALVGCGDSPASLAKESYNLYKDMMKAYEAGEYDKAEQIEGKVEKLNEKIEKLSAEDQAKYVAEYMKLLAADGGSLF